MTNIDIAYLAAIIDGEDCIYIEKVRNSITPRLSILNTNKELINWLISTFKIGTITEKINHTRWKDCYTWRPRVKEIKFILELIVPYLIIKHEQAILMLEFLSIKEKDLYLKEIIRSEVSDLNKKGIKTELKYIERSYKSVNINLLSQEVLSYIAGLFDGEGSIGISRSRKGRSYSYGINCRITNTYLDVIIWLNKITAYGTIISEATKNKSVYRWALSVKEVKILLSLLLPYLKLKKEQALLVLEFINNISYSGTALTNEQIILKNIIYEELKELNKQGR